jgi:Trk K+ transport system NAD-binding subunit
MGRRLRYRFDNALARGPFVVIAYLGALTLFVVLLAAAIATASKVTFGGGLGSSFPEALWQTLLRTLDAGTFAADGPWPTRLLGVAVTLIGVFLAGSLIGLIASAVDQRVEELRRGRGPVVESGHVLILGWSDQVPRIISELVIANESEKRASVVVLATAEKTEMDEVLRERVGDTKSTRVVTRHGDPATPEDLARACVEGAKAIVVVSGEDGDAGVVKAILAVRAVDPAHARCHVVAEINDLDHARTLRTVSRGRVLTVSRDRVVAEVTAQACAQAGLAAVFADLLDFDGDELYLAEVPELRGRTYGEAALAFDASSLIGRRRPDGTTELNPPPDAVLERGDRLILVAEDDSAIAFSGIRDVPVPAPARSPGEDSRRPVHAVIVGWSSFGQLVLEQLDEFLVPGSHITVQVDGDLLGAAAVGDIQLRNATIEVRVGKGGPEDLLSLAEAGKVDQVIVLAYRDQLAAGDADARTLLSLLTLRMIWPAGGPAPVRVLAELADQQNLEIARPIGIDDVIVSDALASLLMAQLVEHPELQAVFDEVFDPEGPVVSLRPAGELVGPDPVAFGVVVAAASAQGMSAFGYRIGATNEVVVNPRKSTVLSLREGDEVVVIETRRPAAVPVAPEAPRAWFEQISGGGW